MARAKKTTRQVNQGLVEVKITLGKGLDGKRIRMSIYGKTKSEAKEAAEEYKEKYRRGEIIDKSVSVVDWAYKWAKVYRQGNNNAASYAFHYESFLKSTSLHFSRLQQLPM